MGKIFVCLRAPQQTYNAAEKYCHKSVGELEPNAVLFVDSIHFMFNAAEKYRHKCIIDADTMYICSLALQRADCLLTILLSSDL